jgi:hypothetical protein
MDIMLEIVEYLDIEILPLQSWEEKSFPRPETLKLEL